MQDTEPWGVGPKGGGAGLSQRHALSDATPGDALDPGWVDEVLLAGPTDDVCLRIGGAVTRGDLRRLVAERQAALVAGGAGRGATIALQLPPSLTYVANLLAGWRAGAQVCLLDHRLTPYETEKILERIAPILVVAP